MVATSDGWVLIVADVGYSQRSWKEFVLPGLTTNKGEASRSLQWVSEFSKRDDCRIVLANHDPEVTPHIIT
jgi:hypothetical protein